MEERFKSDVIPKHFCDSISVGEDVTDAPSLVDVKGYIPLRKQVERLVYAGAQLEAFRKSAYDYDGDYNGEINPSPFQDPDFVPSVDVPIYSAAVSKRIAESVKEASAADGSAAKEASAADGTPQPASDSAAAE